SSREISRYHTNEGVRGGSGEFPSSYSHNFARNFSKKVAAFTKQSKSGGNRQIIRYLPAEAF
ncbi:MAG: hypothetical protein L0211_08325, partial [Planctomycetaceae bacterium]|nr:hypothetical protein [Planctomycetaceae bacterium]